MREQARGLDAEAADMARLEGTTKDLLLRRMEEVLDLGRRPAHYQGTIDRKHLQRIYLGLLAHLAARAGTMTKDELLCELEHELGLSRRAPHYQGTVDKLHLARLYVGLKRRVSEG
jgi:hypothetical protein